MTQNNNKQRLFEVMGRLDKTFKTKLNENFEEIEDEIPAEMSAEVGTDIDIEEPKELSPEEKLAELTAKIDELYALLHSAGEAEIGADEPEEMQVTTGEVDPNNVENLQEWNFDKKKGEKSDDKKEDDKSDDKKEDVDEADEKKEKIPVAAVAKVG